MRAKLLSFILISMVLVMPARAQRSIEFENSAKAGDALIFAVSDETKLTGLEEVIGADALDNIRRAIKAMAFEASAGATVSFVSGAQPYGEIHLVGIDDGDMRRRDWEDLGGRAATLAKGTKAARVTVLISNAQNTQLANAAFGAAVGQHSFDKYKSDATPVVGSLVFVSTSPDTARDAYQQRGAHLAHALKWARDMQSEPANVIYPEEFVRRARAEFKGVSNVSISVLDSFPMRQNHNGVVPNL